MPYVKISDPNIIDVAAWQQVINVVNQHSDSINAITNNFGVQGSGVVNWNSDNDVVHEYTPGSQKMLYGRTRLDPATMDSTDNDHMFWFDIDFQDYLTGTGSFSARPIITATVSTGNATDEPSLTNSQVICTVVKATKDGFRVRLVNSRSVSDSATKVIPITSPLFVNWTAIGPK